MRFLFTNHVSWFEVALFAAVSVTHDLHGWLAAGAVLGAGALISVIAEKHYNI